MDGLTRAEIDKAETKDFALGGKPMRPRDAATLILLDRSGGTVNILMGRRSQRHAFMAGKFVFPGGRTDPADSRVAVAAPLPEAEAAKLTGSGSRASAARGRAIALSAIRETYEEAGLLIGQRGDFSTNRADWQGFADHGVIPSLERIRYVARAVTPPGRVRRFDTRFVACWRDAVAVELSEGGPTDELEEIVWLPLEEAKRIDIPTITRTILNELTARLTVDPELTAGGPVPFYRMQQNRMVRTVI